MIINYNDLKKKDVVNVLSGKILGKISDLVIDSTSGKISKIIVPGKKNSFLSCENLEINYCCVVKIGDDAILVKKGVDPNNNKEDVSFNGEFEIEE